MKYMQAIVKHIFYVLLNFIYKKIFIKSKNTFTLVLQINTVIFVYK